MTTQLLINGRFVAVFPSLVKALDGDLTAAAVLQAIHYRAQIHADADGWLALSLAELGDEIGISRSQAYRAVTKLRERRLLASDDVRGHVRQWRIDYHEIVTLGEQSAAGTVTKSSHPITKSRHHHHEIVTLTSYIEEEEDKNGATSAPVTANVLAQEITREYTDRVPLSKFVAVMGIVKKALKAGYPAEHVRSALIDLADEGRPVTVDTLRVQMDGLAPVASPRDRRLLQTLAWAAEQDARDGTLEVES